MLPELRGFVILYRALPVSCSRYRRKTELLGGADTCLAGRGYIVGLNHVRVTTMEDLT